MSDFKAALARTLAFEGGYSNLPADHGGETYRGISRKYHPDWPGWREIDSLKSCPDFPDCLKGDDSLDLAVETFYQTEYWDRLHCDEFPEGDLAAEVFDQAVNMGPATAGRFLQIGLNVLNRRAMLWPEIGIDGEIGSQTIGALCACHNADRSRVLLKALVIQRGARYLEIMQRDPTQEDFAAGWLNRLTI